MSNTAKVSSALRQRLSCTAIYSSDMENWLSQVGAANKHLTQRYAEYPAQAHDQQLYYTYEPSSPSHTHAASSKHNYGGGHKGNAAMSALTLLAFLFFLHILQQCLKEHMTAMTSPQVMVVSAGREGEQAAAKTNNKLDKAGFVLVTSTTEIQPGVKLNDHGDENASNPSKDNEDMILTRIATEEHVPQEGHAYKSKYFTHTNRSSIFDGFVSAMGEK